MNKSILFLTVLCLAPRVAADPAMECNEPSQVEIAECVSAMLDGVDLAVEASLGLARNAMGELDQVTGREAGVPALDRSQAAWVTYRDTQCEAVGASYGGGSGTGIAITSCRIELGRARASELLELAR
ncbi:lysozyme inhibitor LprI family protein [Ruegeria hyattellae]|uniref:lysozyme inhibitor LprI family protein n=1 Tax=Ruegeria hyattellae TaxID=3233337 RepID=UPI00355AFE4E